MTPTVEGRPSIDVEEISRFVCKHYNIDGAARLLPGEWDQNIKIDCGDSGSFVVKIANRGHRDGFIDFQNAALEWLQKSWTSVECPRLVRTHSGKAVCSIYDSSGGKFLLRVLTYVEGEPLFKLRPCTDTTLKNIGMILGELDQSLMGFKHPGMDRPFTWDLRQIDWISSSTSCIPENYDRGIVERLFLQHRGRVAPIFPSLPMSVIHHDANDANLLLSQDHNGDWFVCGLYDFGDMLRTHTINELAVACAYAIFGTKNPVDVIAKIASGYHKVRPLNDYEIQVLFPQTCMRLCVSVTASAIAAVEDPDNPHRQVSDRDAWETLRLLEVIDWSDAENRIRSVLFREFRQ
jgi:Ser/Thr protein kinase RdoA (MazF antagonist)